jgi:hypothetical protein
VKLDAAEDLDFSVTWLSDVLGYRIADADESRKISLRHYEHEAISRSAEFFQRRRYFTYLPVLRNGFMGCFVVGASKRKAPLGMGTKSRGLKSPSAAVGAQAIRPGTFALKEDR